MLSLAQKLAEIPADKRKQVLKEFSDDEMAALIYDWNFWGRPEQHMPEGDWDFWLLMTGRGWGKTRTGAETVKQWEKDNVKRFHLVGATAADVRDVMIEGESGLLSVYDDRDRPLYEPSKTRITWARRSASGVGDFTVGESAVAYLFSADKPDRLRGPQCEKAWVDEPAAWRYVEAWDNLLLGLRLGKRPQALLTTTPRPIQMLRTLMDDPRCHVTTGSTYDNIDNLAPLFAEEIIRRYEGTRLGRQEIYAEMLLDIEGALWNQEEIDADRWTWGSSPQCSKLVVAIDPAVTSGPSADETGIVAAGTLHKTDPAEYIVIADSSGRFSPDTWGAIAVNLYYELQADYILGEVNQGGDMVKATIHNVDPNVKFRSVRATRGKLVRAEPVSGLYEQHRVHHQGTFSQMEDQMCSYSTETRGSMGSPDRMDALVWALTELAIRGKRKWSLI